jgi:hypothetical protein
MYPEGKENDPNAPYNSPPEPEYEDDIALDDEEPLILSDEILDL